MSPRVWRVALALALTSSSGCGSAPERAAADPAPAVVRPPPLELPPEGKTVRVLQRSRASVPGSAEALSVSLGDITGGRVELVLARTDGSAVLLTQSVGERETVPFVIDGHRYALVVEAMHNALVGDDWIELRVRPEAAADHGGAPALDERARIEALLGTVERSGIVFIRNGREHDAAEAAKHLRDKWAHAGDRVATAEDFIEQLATRSSQSGEAYRVRLPDGTVHDAGPWLRERLAEQAR